MKPLFCLGRLTLGLWIIGLISLNAQISQDHPELCGTPSATIPVPSGLTVTSYPLLDSSEVILTTKKGGRTIEVAGVVEVQEACPLRGDRVLLFGVASPWLYNVVIIDPLSGTLSDSFYAYDPMVSPNQEWTIMRKFYPAGVQATVSEEYLLYDLSKNASANRAASIAPSDMASIGRPVYPRGQQNVTADNIGVPESQIHEFESTSFFWSADSKDVLFADSVQAATSIVLITIGQDGDTSAYVYPLQTSQLCDISGDTPKLKLANVEFQPAAVPSLQMRVVLTSNRAECHEKWLSVNFSDFTAATSEVHTVHHGKPSVMKEK